MTNPIALGLAVVMFLALAADAIFNNWAASFFLCQEILKLVIFVQFWR